MIAFLRNGVLIMKKGIVNIEFMISVFVFLVTIAFILLTLAGSLIPLHKEASLNSLRSVGYQLSQVIIFDQGDPKSWDPTNVNRAGLSTGEKYVISSAKITSFNDTCATNYNRLLDMYFGNKKLLFKVNITDSAGRNMLNCGSVSNPQFSIKRLAVLDTTRDIVEIEISVRE